MVSSLWLFGSECAELCYHSYTRNPKPLWLQVLTGEKGRQEMWALVLESLVSRQKTGGSPWCPCSHHIPPIWYIAAFFFRQILVHSGWPKLVLSPRPGHSTFCHGRGELPDDDDMIALASLYIIVTQTVTARPPDKPCLWKSPSIPSTWW